MGMLHRNKSHNWARNKAREGGVFNVEILNKYREKVRGWEAGPLCDHVRLAAVGHCLILALNGWKGAV
ncbi:MAG TPA: hypothetical protein VLZ51_05125 [Brevundimonas sp.]|jgi:hypothetical protein|nr:hypothetical protein [Brevundimonas sp.]